MNNKKTNETTLTHLTKRFVRLLNSNSERVINLNEASTRLSVAKRRIYDITNVLEGIGLLQKTSKNVTRWVDCPKDSPYAATNLTPKQECNTDYLDETPDSNNPAIGNPELADLKQQVPGINLSGIPDAELLALVKTYQKLDEGVQQLKLSTIQQMNVEGAYVTYQDFKSSFNDQTIIAVKGTPQTWLEVDEHKQIAIRSEPGQQIEVYLCQHHNNNSTNSNNTNNQLGGPDTATQQPQQLQHVYQANVAPQTPPHHLQQSQPSNSTNNSQPLDATFTNTNNLIGQQPQTYTSVSSDEGRGRSTMSTTDGVTYYDPTSGVSDTEQFYNDPTLSSALSGTISEDEDPFIPLVPYDGREEPHYNFVLNDDFPIASLYPEDNLGLL
uniref:Transcription factor E2F3 n=1 Tax=Aceria tosichella TaxID=561515 RepID=A0A6G1SDZ7_9ACAR